MILIRALAFMLHFFIVPLLLGRLITYRTNSSLKLDYLVGFFANQAVFYVLYCFVEWIQNWTTFTEPVTGGFTLLIKIYSAVLVILALLWLWLERKNFGKIPETIKSNVQSLSNEIKADKLVIVYLAMFAGLLLLQFYMAFFYEINEWSYDDYDYVVTSQDTVSSDTLSYVNFIDGSMPNVQEKRAVASWGTYVALLAKVSSFEVTTVYHSILPVMLLIVAYLNFSYIGDFLFKKLDDKLIFLIVTSVAFIFGFYSHYSMTFRLLAALWQGKAVLSVIVMPFWAMYLFEIYSKKVEGANVLPIMLVSLGISSLTSLSMMFVPTVAIIVWGMMSIYHRKIHGVRYLLASLFGPLFLGIFYILVYLLKQDMLSYEDDKYFQFRRVTHWWEKWFH